MTQDKMKPCPFCGAEESERDGQMGVEHKEDCYFLLMESELPGSPLRFMAWNSRAAESGNQFEMLASDLDNDSIPEDLSAYNKIKCKLDAGKMVHWYFKDEQQFAKEEGFNPRKEMFYIGYVMPAPDVENMKNMEPDEVVIVMTDYPCEKCNPEATWFALKRLLENVELVEIYD